MDAADIVAIHQLVGYYGHVVDAADWDGLAEIFTDDAVLDYTGVNVPSVLSGLAEIRAFFAGANHPSAHHVTNIVVTESAGQVRVASKFLAVYSRSTHVPRRWYGGDYRDVVVPTDRGWRIASRTCTARWQLSEEDDQTSEHRRSW